MTTAAAIRAAAVEALQASAAVAAHVESRVFDAREAPYEEDELPALNVTLDEISCERLTIDLPVYTMRTFTLAVAATVQRRVGLEDALDALIDAARVALFTSMALRTATGGTLAEISVSKHRDDGGAQPIGRGVIELSAVVIDASQ